MASRDRSFVLPNLFLLSLGCFLSFILGVCGLPSAQNAAPKTASQPDLKSKLPSYAPKIEACGTESLVRPAQGLSSGERSYVITREKFTHGALLNWFLSNNVEFNLSPVPRIALAVSGGGYRSMLLGAGLVQSFDARDSNDTMRGLYQTLTYQSGLSGGSWLLGTMAGNGFDPISFLSENLWEKALVKNSLYPFNTDSAPEKASIQKDMLDKAAAGFPVTVSEVWGRFVAWQTLRGEDESNESQTVYQMSKIRDTKEFKNYQAPYPIFTALGMENIDDSICDAADNATQYEMHPFEFGSWDAGVSAFTPMDYLGTRVNAGRPAQDNKCTRNFDDLGFLMGTSSTKFNEECGKSTMSIIQSFLDPLVKPALKNASSPRQDLYARYPNPFKGSAGSPKVSKSDELYLVDGGQSNQNNPIWPFIQPARPVDVLFVNDNSADTDDNWPNGTEILHTYNMAKAAGLTRMPFIPDVATFMSKGLNKRATIFGCNKPEQMTIIYLPNAQFAPGPPIANSPTSKFDYAVNETQAMILNGNLIATQNGDPEWSICLGCAISMKATQSLPTHCTKCLEKFCFNG